MIYVMVFRVFWDAASSVSDTQVQSYDCTGIFNSASRFIATANSDGTEAGFLFVTNLCPLGNKKEGSIK